MDTACYVTIVDVVSEPGQHPLNNTDPVAVSELAPQSDQSTDASSLVAVPSEAVHPKDASRPVRLLNSEPSHVIDPTDLVSVVVREAPEPTSDHMDDIRPAESLLNNNSEPRMYPDDNFHSVSLVNKTSKPAYPLDNISPESLENEMSEPTYHEPENISCVSLVDETTSLVSCPGDTNACYLSIAGAGSDSCDSPLDTKHPQMDESCTGLADTAGAARGYVPVPPRGGVAVDVDTSPPTGDALCQLTTRNPRLRDVGGSSSGSAKNGDWLLEDTTKPASLQSENVKRENDDTGDGNDKDKDDDDDDDDEEEEDGNKQDPAHGNKTTDEDEENNEEEEDDDDDDDDDEDLASDGEEDADRRGYAGHISEDGEYVEYSACEICLEDVFVLIRSCCSMKVCRECFGLYLSTSVQDEGRVRIQCPSTTCQVYLKEWEIVTSLKPNEVKKKFLKFLADAGTDPTIKTCPQCGAQHKLQEADHAPQGSTKKKNKKKRKKKKKKKREEKEDEEEEKEGEEEGNTRTKKKKENGEQEVEETTEKNENNKDTETKAAADGEEEEEDQARDTKAAERNQNNPKKQKRKKKRKKMTEKRMKRKEITNRYKEGLRVTCADCGLAWCFPCHAPWHAGVTCGDFQMDGVTEFKEWASKRELKPHLDQVNARRCPECKAYITRTEGCDFMTCRYCSTHFCYECGLTYTSYELGRTQREILLRRLVGHHMSRLSPVGCPGNFLPNRPLARKSIRGCCFGLAMLGLLVLGLLAVAAFLAALPLLIVVGIVALPIYSVVRAVRRRRAEQTFSRA